MNWGNIGGARGYEERRMTPVKSRRVEMPRAVFPSDVSYPVGKSRMSQFYRAMNSRG